MIKSSKYLILCSLVFSCLPTFSATLDWTDWEAGALSRHYSNVDGTHIDVDVNITDENSSFKSDEPDDTSDDVGTALDLYVDFDDKDENITTSITFSVPVLITNLRLRDLDYYKKNNNNKFDDRIIIQAIDDNGQVHTPDHQTLGDYITDNGSGDYESDNTGLLDDNDSKGYVTIQYDDTYIKKLTITYTSGESASSDPHEQHILIDNITFQAKDTDNDGVADFWDIDDDNDGIIDSVEIQGGGTCAYGFFHVIGGVLYIFDEANKVYLPIGGQKVIYNALGYDQRTGKLYASVKRDNKQDDYGNDIDTGDVIEIDRYSGKIKLVKDEGVESSAGEVYNGKLYFKDTNNDKKLSYFDIDTKNITQLDSNKILSLDIAIIGDKGYGLKTIDETSGVDNNVKLYITELSDGSRTSKELTVTTPDGGNLGGWGATFVADGNKLFVSNNNGYLYEIKDYTTDNPYAEFYYNSIVTSSNDGTSCRDANQYAVDTDGDGIPDYQDLDSDNDGIPDNIEAQSTKDYQAPSSTWTDDDGDGLADQYDDDTSNKVGSNGLIPPDSDKDGKADFVDTDSDNDGYSDCEEGNKNHDCSTINIAINGMPEWEANGADYSDVNGNIDEPDPDDSGDLIDRISNNDEAAYRELLCGKSNFQLTKDQWRMISIPCDTGTNSIKTLFGGVLGDYDDNWVMYKQTGDDNYETNSSHKNTNKTKLTEDDTLTVGISYWIITDDDHTLNIDETLSGLSPTTTVSKDSISISDNAFDKVHEANLPANSANNVKKFMAGNPLPFRFDFSKLYFKNENTDYKVMGDSNNDSYILARIYTHDSSDESDKNVSDGGGYTVIAPQTPGLSKGQVVPMEGFFIQLEKQSDEKDNKFAYPLMQQYGN